MASSRNSKGKSSGLRILWIPGGRKSHSKGRYDATNKQTSHLSRQKKSEVWSLGGSKAQKDLLNAPPETASLDGPSVSGLQPLTCTVGAIGVAQCPTVVEIGEPKPSTTSVATAGSSSDTATHTSPKTPDSTTSTAPLISVPNSPEAFEASNSPSSSTTAEMPAKTTSTIITTTATAEIFAQENRYAILTKDISDEIDVYDLPAPPKDDLNARVSLLNTSADTTASTESGSVTPTKKKSQHKNYNNNHQDDVNSIENISETPKIPSISNLDWIDDVNLERPTNELLQKSKKKKKKKLSTAKELDQLDGVPVKPNNTESPADDDEKVVKCLYYTLMCCDCTIS